VGVLIQPYNLDELEFAFCYRLYLRWSTHRRNPQSHLAELDPSTLEAIAKRYDMRILESSSSKTDVRLMASLKPQETVSACASKLKGQISKWLRGRLGRSSPENLLSKGYFACTTGKTTADAVNRYLDEQSEHHGYSDRPSPPVFLREYALSQTDERRLKANHAATHLQHHIVLATWRRFGVFEASAGESVAARWRTLLRERNAALRKISFVPDHVHIAIRVHPSVSPARLIVEMMNSAQEQMWSEFANSVIRARVERLWQPSAYLGSFGDLESAKISKYIRQWETQGRQA
jgi:REP element-mobilizing transposase RayT